MPNGVIDDRAIAGPATHAIVIGVGAYPHLPGGGAALTKEPEGMTQLTSPPISARKFAEWLILKHHVPTRPLATVALLLSEARPKPFVNPRTGVSMPVEVATIGNIRSALESWRARGDAQPDQRLMFYFCGHGMGKGSDLALLAADYGASVNDPLNGAIDFRNFLAGMQSSAAAEQVYFVDACRVHSGSLLRAGGYNGQPIFQPNLAPPPIADLRAPVFYASIQGAPAYGYPRKPSLYTEALLHGLDGAGANNDEGDWRVTTLDLMKSLTFDLERPMKRVGRASLPTLDNARPIELHYLPPGVTPTVAAILECLPETATRAARFSYQLGPAVTSRPGNRLGSWTVPLPANTYTFSADFPSGRWQAQPESVWIKPPFRRVKIKAI